MSRFRRTLFRLLFGALGVLTLAAVPAASEETPKDQQIADIERQIKEITRKLEELKKGAAAPTPSSPEGTLPADWVKSLNWRSIGPAAMGGRIIALAIYEADPSTYWVATASGGLLKTTNNGTTFEHQFDRETTVSIGDVCVAPSDKNIVWVGTGENNPRNSVSWGDGVYKSTDGGKTWKNMGLKKSFQIGKILIRPKDPNTVYVGALGRLYGPNEERGLFKTTDGGQTWQKALYVDDKTGVIDMVMKPDDPNSLIVATWERQRDGHDSHPGNEMPPAEGYDRYDPIKKWGPGSGLHKTTDGGKTWKKLTSGLPTNPLGRVGLDVYRKNPNTVFAVIDCQKIGMGTPPRQTFLGVQGEDSDAGPKLTQVVEGGPGAKAGLKVGDIVKAADKAEIKQFQPLVQLVQSKKAGDKITLTVQRGSETLNIVVTLEDRPAPVAGGGPGGGGRGGRGGQGGGRGGMGAAMLLGAFGQDAEGGVQVARLLPDGAAAKAGVLDGDLIKAFDKKPVTSFRQIVEELANKKAGDKVTLQVKRGADTRDLVVTLLEPPQGFGPGGATATRPYNFMYGGQQPNVQDRQGPNSHEYGGVYKSTDFGETWTRVNSLNPRPMYFSVIRVDPSDDKFLYVLGVSLHRSKDGGKTFTDDGSRGVHPDQHALWINPKDGRHMIVGCDGGFYVTHDRMEHWDFLNHMAIGQFYHVAVDPRRPYRVYGGLQDNASWGGPSQSFSDAGPINEDWFVLGGGDGFVCRVDPSDPDLVYWESQDGNIMRRHLKTGEISPIRPQPPAGAPPYRFNWNTPFILSNHNPRIFYSAGNFVFRSLDRGRDLKVISPEITRTKRGSATALAESPRNPDVLWVGSDDGALFITRDGGKTWTNVADKVGLPGPRWVASIEPSRGADGRCYVAFDGHRSDDDEPYVYMTEDFGQTWKSIRANLPWGSTRVLREDLKNPNLLYVGTEFGAWASLNRGQSWTKINNNLPTVAVHEFAQHPTAGEVVVATHGRSLWAIDVTTLRQISQETMTAKAHLYQPNTAVNWRTEPARGSVYGTGSRKFVGQNPPAGAQVFYSLAKKAEKVNLKIVDYAGKTVVELPASPEPGLRQVTWNLRRGQQGPGGGGRGGAGGGGFGGGFGALRVPAGTYRVVLTVDGQELSQPLLVENDPTLTPSLIATEEAAEAEKAKGPPQVDF